MKNEFNVLNRSIKHNFTLHGNEALLNIYDNKLTFKKIYTYYILKTYNILKQIICLISLCAKDNQKYIFMDIGKIVENHFEFLHLI